METSHVFKDPVFWKHFQNAVESRSWKCNFPNNILIKSLDKDATLYKDDIILRKRRNEAIKWVENDSLWIGLILGACKELADGQKGFYTTELENLQMLEPFTDFVEHLNCFYTVASEMKSMGRSIKPLSQDSSQLHDIDKLDPIMMVGYSERFEDNKTTSVWDTCMERHTHVNPHHQAHYLWNQDVTCCGKCPDIMDKALSEMICDKVSRRLQKQLNGKVSNDMWDVDLFFFEGLPQNWIDKAIIIMEDMKRY